MLTALDLTLRRGPEPLFERVDFTVFRSDKIGVTGAYGSGKSSLFAALRGELAPDRGDIDLPSGLRIAHVEQEIATIDRAARSNRSGRPEWRRKVHADENVGGRSGAGKFLDAPRRRDTLSDWRRELEQIERRLTAIAAERALIEAALCACAEHRILEARKARLTRDAASLEARWMEVGTAIEEAVAR
jgi:ATPase subunit of ABC transporter with duplicated ATPase domains